MISLKWSRSRKRIPTGEPDAVAALAARPPSESTKLGRLGRPVSESCRTRWRSACVGGVALDRVGEDVGRGLDEVDVLRGEAARLGRVDVEHAEGLVLALDHDREAAAHPEHAQRRRHREALLGRPVVDDHVQAGLERGAGVGVARRRDALAGADHLALEAGAQVEAAAVAVEPPRCRRSRRPRSRSISETASSISASGSPSAQRPLAEPGDRRLLGGRPLQLLLGDLALGDVVEDAVPDRDAGLVGLEHRLVEDPDDLAVAGASSGSRPAAGCGRRGVLRFSCSSARSRSSGCSSVAQRPGSAIHSSGV